MLRACIICKDEYYGDSWGVTFTNTSHDFEDPTFPDKIVVCFYCHAGCKDRQWKPEWMTEEKESTK
jgi:hypothetical protein